MSAVRHVPIMMRHFRHVLATVATLAVAFGAAATARAAGICGEGTYAYAGFGGGADTSGIAATIGQAGPLDVRDGHVAGWVGIVDPVSGSAWLQAGLSALPSDTTSRIYYEVAFPGRTPAYHELEADVRVGVRHRFAVLELRARPGWWRVWLDGRPATAPLHLRGSHHHWTAQAIGESWAGAASGSCNRYAYAFRDVFMLGVGGRRTAALGRSTDSDPDYAVERRSRASFVAASRSPAGR